MPIFEGSRIRTDRHISENKRKAMPTDAAGNAIDRACPCAQHFQKLGSSALPARKIGTAVEQLFENIAARPNKTARQHRTRQVPLDVPKFDLDEIFVFIDIMNRRDHANQIGEFDFSLVHGVLSYSIIGAFGSEVLTWAAFLPALRLS